MRLRIQIWSTERMIPPFNHLSTWQMLRVHNAPNLHPFLRPRLNRKNQQRLKTRSDECDLGGMNKAVIHRMGF